MFGTLLPNSSILLLGIGPVFVYFRVFLLKNFIITVNSIDVQNNRTGPIRFLEQLHVGVAPPPHVSKGGGVVEMRGTLFDLCFITQQAI